MHTNLSPWLHQVKRTRPINTLSRDTKTDIVIIGGGISGVVTAYYTLKLTHKKVLLLEAGKVAHGATGHNAGQVASYFERPLADIVREFGEKMATEGQQAVDSAWILLEEIFEDAKLQTPLWQFTGYAGCRLQDVVERVYDIFYQRRSGMAKESMLLAEEYSNRCRIPRKMRNCFTVMPHQDILRLLETNNHHYVAALVKRKGCMNSAMFTEELAGYLVKKYAKRFTLLEHTPVRRIALHKNHAVMEAEPRQQTRTYTITGERMILCTNGFEKINILDIAGGTDVDGSFHHLVEGSVGYMAGYLDERDAPPLAISYLPEARSGFSDPGTTQSAEPYFYLTRRPYKVENQEDKNLICIGGPESLLKDTNAYIREKHPYPREAEDMINRFVHKNYRHAPKRIRYAFQWHGLMGYTPNGIRCVGFEPRNHVLMYNLGCNGVGILTSIYGGKRIALLLQGRKLSPSIFDPRT